MTEVIGNCQIDGVYFGNGVSKCTMTVYSGRYEKISTSGTNSRIKTASNTVTIEGGEIGKITLGSGKNAANINGGVFKEKCDTATVKNGYIWAKTSNANYPWRIVPNTTVAMIGSTTYTSLEDAVNAAQSGDTILLLQNVYKDITEFTIEKNLTVDINENILSVDRIHAYGDLTIKNGKIVLSEYNGSIISVYKTLNLEKLEVISRKAQTAIDVKTGGTLYISDPQTSIDNLTDAYAIRTSYKANVIINDGVILDDIYVSRPVSDSERAHITITGGKLKGKFVSNSNVVEASFYDITGGYYSIEPAAELIAEGYKVVESGDEVYPYKVVYDNSVAKIGNTGYETLADAIKAAQNGDTIILLKDTEGEANMVATLDSDKNFTIDLNGKTWNNMYFSVDGNLTLLNGKYSGTHVSIFGTLTIDNVVVECTNNNAYAIGLSTNGKLIIKGEKSVVRTTSQYGVIYVNGAGSTVTISDGLIDGYIMNVPGNITITGGTFTDSIINNGILTVTGGKIKEIGANSTAQTSITGGLFINKPDDKYVPEGYKALPYDDETYKYQVVPHVHTFGAWTSDGTNHVRTCTTAGCGYAETHEASYGDWTDADETNHVRICTECDVFEKEAHTYGTPQFTWVSDPTVSSKPSVERCYVVCSVCQHEQEIKGAELIEDDSDPEYLAYTAAVTYEGVKYIDPNFMYIPRTYTVIFNDSTTEYPYNEEITLDPDLDSDAGFDFYDTVKSCDVPLAKNACSLTLNVTRNMVIKTKPHTGENTAPVIEITTKNRVNTGKTDYPYKVPFMINWALDTTSKCEIIDAGIYYRYGKEYGVGDDAITVDYITTNGKKKSSGMTCPNGTYALTINYSGSYANRNIYAVGYVTYKDAAGQTQTVWTKVECNKAIK